MSHCPVCNRQMPDVSPGQPQSCKVCGWTTRGQRQKTRKKRTSFKAESAEDIARRETAKSPFSVTSMLVIGLGVLIIIMLTLQTLQTNNSQESEEYIPVYHSAKPSATAATPTPVYTFMSVPSAPASPEASESPTATPSPTLEQSPENTSSSVIPPALTESPAPEVSASPE